MSLKESKIIICSLFIGVSFVFYMSLLSNTLSLDSEEYIFESLIYYINNNYIENISLYYNKYLFLNIIVFYCILS